MREDHKYLIVGSIFLIPAVLIAGSNVKVVGGLIDMQTIQYAVALAVVVGIIGAFLKLSGYLTVSRIEWVDDS